MAWKFETCGLDGQCELFGVNIFKYRWRDCRETAAVTDPHYGVEKAFHVYEVEIDGQLRRFAAGEQKLKRAKKDGKNPDIHHPGSGGFCCHDGAGVPSLISRDL